MGLKLNPQNLARAYNFLRLLVEFWIHSQAKVKHTTLFLNFSNILIIKKISPSSSAKHRGIHLLVNKMFKVLLSA